MSTPRTVEDVEGPWQDPEFESGLVRRCRENWSVPIEQLTNEALATFLRQRIAISLVVPEARKRVAAGYDDGSEIYEGELAVALEEFRA